MMPTTRQASRRASEAQSCKVEGTEGTRSMKSWFHFLAKPAVQPKFLQLISWIQTAHARRQSDLPRQIKALQPAGCAEEESTAWCKRGMRGLANRGLTVV